MAVRKVPCDGKADARTRYPVGQAVAHAIERVKDPRPLAGRHPRPVVLNHDADHVAFSTATDRHVRPSDGVLLDVAEEIAHDLVQRVVVERSMAARSKVKPNLEPLRL
jgi:hypothetical protein